MALAEGLREAGLDDLARRAAAFADGMSFRLLYDTQRRIFSIGYRLADPEGPGRLDPSYYDLLASEARLASFIAIAKGDVPETHWFHLGRLVTSVHGTPTLLSWSATMFEYLMPLLVLKSYPDTLLDAAGRMAVRRADRVRGGSRRAVGHLRVRLQRGRPPRQLPVQGLRRARPRPEARARRRARGGAVRDRPRGHDRSHGGGAKPAPPGRRRTRRRVRLLRVHRLHARADGRRPARRRRRPPGAPWCARTWRTTRA